MDVNQDDKKKDIEQRISDAELEAQKAQAPAPEQTGSAFDGDLPKSEAGETPPQKKALSKGRKVWRRILIWLVVIAIAFAGGFFLDAKLRLEPALNEADVLRAELDASTAEITTLNAEVERLGAFEDQNTSLAAEIGQMEIHLNLLSARSAVADASLAIEQGRKADARLALTKAGSALETLQSLVSADQAEVVDNMVQRYRLILIELDNDEYSVQTDLDLLTTRLITLENNLFAAP